MSAETLALTGGALLSLLFGYVPGFKNWFGAKEPVIQRLIMAVSLLVVSALTFGAGCANLQLPGVVITCDTPGLWALFQIFLLALVANQGMYSITSASSAERKEANMQLRLAKAAKAK